MRTRSRTPPANVYGVLERGTEGVFSSILDVGCNDGYMVKVFQDEGKKAAGINDSLMPVDWAYIEDNNLAVLQGDMHNMDFPDAVFEAVWCRHTLEHSFAPLQVLAEVNRA